MEETGAGREPEDLAAEGVGGCACHVVPGALVPAHSAPPRGAPQATPGRSRHSLVEIAALGALAVLEGGCSSKAAVHQQYSSAHRSAAHSSHVMSVCLWVWPQHGPPTAKKSVSCTLNHESVAQQGSLTPVPRPPPALGLSGPSEASAPQASAGPSSGPTCSTGGAPGRRLQSHLPHSDASARHVHTNSVR